MDKLYLLRQEYWSMLARDLGSWDDPESFIPERNLWEITMNLFRLV